MPSPNLRIALSNIAVIRLTDSDIVRHPLVAEMLGVLDNDNHTKQPIRPETLNGGAAVVNGSSLAIQSQRAGLQ